MELALGDLLRPDRYKVLTALVVPRPIAWISTWSENGVANCAPFSFFNLVSSEPPLCAIGINTRADGTPKDTVRNIRRTGEFVLNLVDESTARRMRVTGNEFPGEVSEFKEAGLTPVAASKVGHPRVAEAAASLECIVNRLIAINEEQEIVIAEVVHLHTRDGVIDPNTLRVSEDSYRPIGRLHGTRYCTTRDRFDLPGDPSVTPVRPLD